MEIQKLKKIKYLFLVVCFLLVFLIYSQSIFGGFVYDDRSIVSHQNILEDIENTPEILSMPYWQEDTGLYRPVTVLSYSLNFILFGDSPMSFHLINLIFYALTCHLLFILLLKLFPKNKLVAIISSLIYLILPIHTEAVANIVGRAEIFAFFFSLLSLIELSKPELTEVGPLSIRERMLRFLKGSYASPWKAGSWFLIALLSKETAIAVIPLAFFVLLYKKRQKINLNLLKKYTRHFVILFTSLFSYFAIRFLILGYNFLSNTATIVENPLKFAPTGERIATAFEVLSMYVGKSFIPFGLCSDYSYNQIPTHGFWHIETIIGIILFLFFLFSMIFFLGRRPILSFASAIFLFSYFPVSNLILKIGTIGGERLMFLPTAGLSIYLAYGIHSLRDKYPKKIFSRIFAGFLILIILFYSVISFNRAFAWMSEEKLFLSAGKCAPQSVLSVSNLGMVYYFKGDLKKAENIFKEAEEIYPEYSKGLNNLGLVYWKQEEFKKAKGKYLEALSVENPYMGAYKNLYLLLLSEGKKEEASRWLKVIRNVRF